MPLRPEIPEVTPAASVTLTAAAEDKWHPPFDHRDQYAHNATAVQRSRHASADTTVLPSPEMSSIGSYLVSTSGLPLVVPAAQGLHVVVSFSSAYVPAAHLVHALAPAAA
jgi:hypothetical protein